MTPLQHSIYEHFTRSAAARKMLHAAESGKGAGCARVLSAITALKKLCNHPKLIYDAINSNTGNSADGFEVCTRPGTLSCLNAQVNDFWCPFRFGHSQGGRYGVVCITEKVRAPLATYLDGHV